MGPSTANTWGLDMASTAVCHQLLWGSPVCRICTLPLAVGGALPSQAAPGPSSAVRTSCFKVAPLLPVVVVVVAPVSPFDPGASRLLLPAVAAAAVVVVEPGVRGGRDMEPLVPCSCAVVASRVRGLLPLEPGPASMTDLRLAPVAPMLLPRTRLLRVAPDMQLAPVLLSVLVPPLRAQLRADPGRLLLLSSAMLPNLLPRPWPMVALASIDSVAAAAATATVLCRRWLLRRWRV
jgi:hypothetical protein